MFNSHLNTQSDMNQQVFNTPPKNDNQFQKDKTDATPPQKSRFANYSNESVNKMLKAPVKKGSKGLNISDETT